MPLPPPFPPPAECAHVGDPVSPCHALRLRGRCGGVRLHAVKVLMWAWAWAWAWACCLASASCCRIEWPDVAPLLVMKRGPQLPGVRCNVLWYLYTCFSAPCSVVWMWMCMWGAMYCYVVYLFVCTMWCGFYCHVHYRHL